MSEGMAPAGWYPDSVPGRERYWTGEGWSEETRMAPPPMPAGPPPGYAQATAPQHVQYMQPAYQPALQPAGVTALYHDTTAPVKLGGLGTWVSIALGATMLGAVIELIGNQRYIGVESDLINGKPQTFQHVQSVTHASHTIHTIVLLLALATAILFIVWFHRAYRNLVRAGIADLRFSPGWAIGGWFIPIFSLVRQKQIANDIWKASASARTVGIGRWREMPLASLVNWWWGVWIAAGLLGGFGNFRVSHADSQVHSEYGVRTVVTTTFQTLKDERTGIWISQVGLIGLIVAGALAIRFVREVSRMQDEGFV
jgi:hypothetical protein